MDVSAEPDRLLAYVNSGINYNQVLSNRNNLLNLDIQNFYNTCTEPGFRIDYSNPCSNIQHHIEKSESLDMFVKDVAHAFIQADSSASIIGTTNSVIDESSLIEQFLDYKFPFLLEFGLGMIAIGDILDILRSIANGLLGRKVDYFILGIAVVGLLTEFFDIADAPVSAYKAIVKEIPEVATRELLTGTIFDIIKKGVKEPDLLLDLNKKLVTIAKNDELLTMLKKHPEAFDTLLKEKHEVLELTQKYGEDGIKLIDKYKENGVELIKKWPEGDIPKTELDSLIDAPLQDHHVATKYEKDKNWATRFQNTFSKYNLDIEGNWNIINVFHRGPHPDEYHQWVYGTIRDIVREVGNNKETFLQEYNLRIIDEIKRNPLLLRKIWYK